MKNTLIGLCGLALLAACGGPNEAKHPQGAADVTTPLANAFHEEMGGDQNKAIDLYLSALSTAAVSPDHPASIDVMQAALDALVSRDVLAFSDNTTGSALADRVPGANIDARLAKIEASAQGPFARALIANARLELAERRGDANTATTLRNDSGCAREMALVGPVAWMTVTGVHDPGVLDKAGRFPSDVPGPGPFTPSEKPRVVAGFGCHLPLYAETPVLGVRELAVDVEVPAAGWIGVGVNTNAAAVLKAGGVVAIDRAHQLGGRKTPRFARVNASQGTMRLVLRVGMDIDFSSVELGAWDENGKPLKAHAPKAGDAANATVKNVAMVLEPPAKTDADRIAIALGELASGDGPDAENLLAASAALPNASADLLLVYGRAIRGVRDLPAVKSQERARSAYERALEQMPSSWEATLEHASLAGARRARAEANIEALTALDHQRAKGKVAAGLPTAFLDAYEAQIAGREGLYDRADAALGRAKTPLAGTSLLADTDRTAIERTGKDLAAFDCSDKASNRASLACHNDLVNIGDRAGAGRELERLRALGGTPQLYLSLSTRQALETGDLARASKLLSQMNPGDRALSSIYAVKGKAAAPELLALAPTSRDAPMDIASLLRDAGDDPLVTFDGVADKAINDASATPLLANAATAVLAHREKYVVESNGLVHYTMLDVRRVMGTTDVEANAEAAGPQLYGRDAVRVLRRRIFKKDGRIVLPDPTPRAAQSHADLSQLEAGDAIEAIYEGWGLPNETGNIGIDTPDLLPERTAVHDASIEIQFPSAVKSTLWAHPLMGKAEERDENGKHVMVWKMKDHATRRVEAGVAKMDRQVGVSLSTTTWEDVARGIRETVASLEASSPEVSDWARTAAGGLKPSKALVEKIVAASGQAVKESNGIILSDIDLGRAGSHGMTARNILVTHEGSRTWLIVHALRELGVKTDIAIAENDPYSSSPSFPPHFGRFMHPLAVAHVPEGDVWIDADVSGPPLPAGKISPELRGRQMVTPEGKIAAVPAVGGESERDEVDIRLALDDKGDAKGTITVLLRGETAQNLSEALVRIVGVERQRALRGIALGWVPFATVDKVELSSSEGSWQVAVRADLTAPAYAQALGTKPETRIWDLPGIDPIHYVFPRPFVTTLSSTYASQSSRESALAINNATQYHVRRRIDLPAKASIARLPGPFDEKGPLMTAARKISVTGQSIEEDFTLDVTTGTIPQAQYEQFVSAAHHADDAFRASTRVKPPAAP